MKKNVLLILLSFIVNISITAQIQRKFFNFELTKTTKSEVVSYFEGKGKICNVVDDIVVVENVRFGGVDWHTAFFSFYDNVLSVVSFSVTEETKPKSSLDKIQNDLICSLNKKYPGYFDSQKSDHEVTIYNDGLTDLMLRYSLYNGTYNLMLMYADLEIMRKIARNDIDEL